MPAMRKPVPPADGGAGQCGLGAGVVDNRCGQPLDSGSIPTFPTASRAMVCLNAFIRYRLIRRDEKREAWLKWTPSGNDRPAEM